MTDRPATAAPDWTGRVRAVYDRVAPCDDLVLIPTRAEALAERPASRTTAVRAGPRLPLP